MGYLWENTNLLCFPFSFDHKNSSRKHSVDTKAPQTKLFLPIIFCTFTGIFNQYKYVWLSFLASPEVEVGFLNHLLFFNLLDSFGLPFFSPLLTCLLFFTSPNKAIIWFMEENRGCSKLFLIVIFRAQPPSFLPFCSLLGLFLYFHPIFLLLFLKDACCYPWAEQWLWLHRL